MKRKHLFVLGALMLSSPGLAAAQDPGFDTDISSAEEEAKVHGHEEGLMTWPGITGNWGGVRSSLENNGFTIEAVYTGENVTNFSGGAFNKKGSIYHDNLDLALTVDTEKAGMWPGGTLFVYGLRNNGGDPSVSLIGDLQTASNIEAPNQFIVNEAWYEQNFADGMLSILAGLHDLNSEFYVSEYASLFLNSSPGIGPEVSGNVPTSLFPKAALGARIRVIPAEGFYLQGAIYDGDPATRGFKKGEGQMDIVEAGYSWDGGAYKAGYWLHTAQHTPGFAGAKTYNNDYGYYGIIDQRIVQLEGDSSIGVYLQLGQAPTARNDITGYVGAGVHMHGIVPTRDEDDLGFAVASARTHLNTENAYELTYRAVITPWLALQPSFQWIQNPGGDATVPTAKVGLIRFEVTL